jgi:tetratricopeptide (TPR) repeat protein
MRKGMTLHRNNQLQEAFDTYMDVVDAHPRHFDALHLAGVILVQVGHSDKALGLLDRAVEVKPSDPEVYYNRGNARFALQKYKEAIADYSRSITLKPQSPLAMFAQGNALRECGQQQAAILCYDAAMGWMKDYAPLYFNRGNAFVDLGNTGDAEKSFRAAIEVDPAYVEAHHNLGTLYLSLKRFDQAKACFGTAIGLKPDNPESFANLGVAHMELQEYPQALEHFEKALAMAPFNAEVHHSMSHCLLQLGQFDRAWQAFHWRWQTHDFVGKELSSLRPKWVPGAPVKTLLVWAEQGVGDEIFWSALLPELQRQGMQLMVQIDARLIPLMQRAMPGIAFIARTDPVDDERYDAHLPMGDLGLAVRRTRADFDRTPRGFLQPDSTRSARIRQALCPPGQRLCGLSWRSKNVHFGDEKSMTLEHLLPVLQTPGLTFVNLQYGDVSAELAQLKADHGIEVLQYTEVDNLQDLGGLADLVAACDVVVSTSNTTAHLAGALGKDTLLLLPFGRARIWYWLNEHEGRSLWYPSVRLLAQRSTAEGWQRVSREAAALLREPQNP